MDRVKFTIHSKQSYPIDVKTFEVKTLKKYPYYQESLTGEIAQFAICPECDNPVQVIGLYKTLANTNTAYGKHYAKPVTGIGIYNKENYLHCPYRAERQSLTKSNKKQGLDNLAYQVIQRMVLYFDKIVWLLQKEMGLYISLTLAKQMLDDFFHSQSYLYKGASLRNMPLVLAYFSLNKGIIGRKVLPTSLELLKSIREVEELYLEGNQIKSHRFSDAGFYFHDHKTHLINHHLTESLIFTISKGTGDHVDKIYEKMICFDNNHIENLLTFEPKHLNEMQKKRNQQLLATAIEIAQEYGFMNEPDF